MTTIVNGAVAVWGWGRLITLIACLGIALLVFGANAFWLGVPGFGWIQSDSSHMRGIEAILFVWAGWTAWLCAPIVRGIPRQEKSRIRWASFVAGVVLVLAAAPYFDPPGLGWANPFFVIQIGWSIGGGIALCWVSIVLILRWLDRPIGHWY